jgi:hypothetical protein
MALSGTPSISNQTFTDFGKAAQDIFSSQANAAGLRIQAQGTDLEAAGTRIQAKGSLLTAQGDLTEAADYTLASSLAEQNALFTKASTAIQQTQADRQLQMSLGETQASLGAAGLSGAGSGTELLRASVAQGSLNKSMLGSQGLIQEAGFEEQAQSYTNLANFARYGAGVETEISGEQQKIATGQDAIAASQRALANKTETQGEISAAISTAAAVASLFIA